LDVRYLIRWEQRGHLNAFGARLIAHAAKIKIAPAENRTTRLSSWWAVADAAKIIKIPRTTEIQGTKGGIACTSSSYYVFTR
jgi:hypothetical protein